MEKDSELNTYLMCMISQDCESMLGMSKKIPFFYGTFNAREFLGGGGANL